MIQSVRVFVVDQVVSLLLEVVDVLLLHHLDQLAEQVALELLEMVFVSLAER